MKTQITGPYTHLNLSLFLLHSAEIGKGPEYLDFNSGVGRGELEILETGQVAELAVNNHSNHAAYLQYGDVVEGGKQDRTFLHDVIIPPASKAFPVKTYCIEKNRWEPRPADSNPKNFRYPNKAISHPVVRKALLLENNQHGVWAAIDKLETGRRGAGVLAARPGAPENTGSYLKYMAGEKNASAQRLYVEEFAGLIGQNPDAAGFGYCINGTPYGIDLYGTHSLLLLFWPKLLASIAYQAAVLYPPSEKIYGNAGINDFKLFVQEAVSSAVRETIEIAPRTKFIKKMSLDSRLSVNETYDLAHQQRVRLSAFSN